MERLLSQGIIPVIVGGTNYYIESLLWNVLVDSAPEEEVTEDKLVYERDKEYYERPVVKGESGQKRNKNVGANCDENVPKKSKNDSGNPKNNNALAFHGEIEDDNAEQGKESEVKENVEKLKDESGCIAWQDCDVPTEDLYQRLLEVDPTSAMEYHPNNRRKIIRSGFSSSSGANRIPADLIPCCYLSLQVWEQTGRQHSEVLKEQRQQVGGSHLGGALRFQNTAILWITCQQDVLDERLDERVDDMIKRGLLQELTDFHMAYNTARLRDGQDADYTKGIFQSIGFKEFHQYLILPESERIMDEGKKLYLTGVENLKQVTRRYSRKQVRWIRNRFILPSKRQVPPVYTVDGTDPKRWDTKVKEPALSIVQALLEGEKPSYDPVKFSKTAEFADIDTNDKTRFECDVCGRVVIGQLQWHSHLKGAKHRKMLKRKHQTN
ncbi:tRNA dimethylallyltransferase isoform X1 [Macrobrachium rosenbergii]|uniref:tRNA dimethylallyltransferase isoform X1 n=1 Tax=Macrobrachium rosenbergii TaxID=79674 RepID=UPI0034D4AF5B